jgi:predicted metal-dependent hydrolase
MSQKTVVLPGIGEVLLSKRKGTRNLRLSISSDGRVRVGMPYWAPYHTGIKFAQSRVEWIRQHQASISKSEIKDGGRVGGHGIDQGDIERSDNYYQD